MSDSDAFIEMSREGDELGDEPSLRPPSRVRGVARLAGSVPALGLSSLIVGSATFLSVSAAANVGDLVLYTRRNIAYVDSIRWASGFRLVIAVIALGLGIVAALRLAADQHDPLDDDFDDDDLDDEAVADAPASWVRTVVGAALLVGLLAVIINGLAFIDAIQAHSPADFGFSSN
jgi:hypothetical protein